jgi:hypothetical protein
VEIEIIIPGGGEVRYLVAVNIVDVNALGSARNHGFRMLSNTRLYILLPNAHDL